MRWFVAFLLLSLAAVRPAYAAPADVAGTWVWQVGGKTLIVLKLEAEGEGLSGTLERPREIEMSPLGGTYAVTRVELPVVAHPLTFGGERAGAYLVHAADPAGGAARDYLVSAAPGGGLVLALAPDEGAPRLMLRHPPAPDRVATDWEAGRMYLAEQAAEPSNPEMGEIFAADQADRTEGVNTDWKVVGPRDRARETRVRAMLEQGLLRSGEDYAHAAFVLQHGEEPEDYLLAHALAMTAQAKGRLDAGWIAAASLDRYLSSIGKRTVFGTQFDNSGKRLGVADDLVTDAMRTAVGVPPLAEQGP